MSSIHEAALAGDVNRVQHLLEQGISVDSRRLDQNDTPLHLAATEGELEVVELLIKNKCDINAKDKYGKTALILAAIYGHNDVIELLLQSGSDIQLAERFMGLTALHWSTNEGHIEATKYLIQSGADVNAKSTSDATPLMLTYCPEIVALLLQSGADVKCCTVKGCTALHFAAINTNNKNYCCHHEPCKDLVLEGQKVIELLLESGSDPNARNSKSETPLILAAQNLNPKAARMLIRFGADLHAKDERNKTVFTQAVESIRKFGFLSNPFILLELITLFIESGAYIDRAEYMIIYGIPFLRESIFENVRLCTQSILNKVKSVYLPAVYKFHGSINRLPPMESLMKSMSENAVLKDIENSVTDEIKSKTFCNVMELRPKNLQLLAVRSLVEKPLTIKRAASDTNTGGKKARLI